MIVEFINNPRKENGDFGPVSCDLCGCYTSAYVEFLVSCPNDELDDTVVCKGCLLAWVEQIDKIVLDDVIKKGRLRRRKNV
jgi:hypothetical protein